jgi:hypothetical protein
MKCSGIDLSWLAFVWIMRRYLDLPSSFLVIQNKFRHTPTWLEISITVVQGPETRIFVFRIGELDRKLSILCVWLVISRKSRALCGCKRGNDRLLPHNAAFEHILVVAREISTLYDDTIYNDACVVKPTKRKVDLAGKPHLLPPWPKLY